MARVRRCRPLLGTFVAIRAEHPRLGIPELQARLDEAFRAMERVQALMSFHDPSSELSRLNAGAHRGPLEVHPWTRRVLEVAVRIGDASAGAFDVAVAVELVRRGLLPDHLGSGRATDAGSYRDLRLHDDGRVSFARPLRIDLGGIAKGFAADRAARVLEGAGVVRGVVDAGGDLRFVGPPPRRILLRSPRAPWRDRIEVAMEGPAVASSAGCFAARRRRGRGVAPLVDPRSGRPIARRAGVSVFAPTATRADALTKVVAVATPEVWRPLLAAEGASAVVLPA